MALALEGIRVIDVSQVAAVPMAARHLADFGAEVIHVEHPQRGDMYRTLVNRFAAASGGLLPEKDWIWENFNRNKKSLTLDLSRETGREIMHKLVKKADVFLANLRPYELERYGLEYPTLSGLNPRLVFATLTGYGKKGPENNSPGFDFSSLWARSGIAHVVPTPGCAPDTPPGAFGDNVAALGLALGVMMALFVRERTGRGQEVDLSLFHTGLYQLSQDIAGALVAGPNYEVWRSQVRQNFPNPLVKTYQTKDARWLLFIVLQPDRYWSLFCRAIDRQDLENDPRFATTEAREENSLLLKGILQEVFLTKTLEQWRPRLKGIPFDAVQTLTEAVTDPQARANGMFVSFDHPTHGPMEMVASPINLSETPASVRIPAPEFSQHTEEILLDLGCTWDEIVKWKEEGVIA